MDVGECSQQGFHSCCADPKGVTELDVRDWVAKSSARIWRGSMQRSAWIYRKVCQAYRLLLRPNTPSAMSYPRMC